MSDTISRQAAIDAFCTQCTVDKPETCSTMRYGDKWCNEVYTILNAPTVDAVEVVRCRDCEHKDRESGFCHGRGWPMQLVPDDGFCDKGKGR